MEERLELFMFQFLKVTRLIGIADGKIAFGKIADAVARYLFLC